VIKGKEKNVKKRRKKKNIKNRKKSWEKRKKIK